MAFCNNAQTMYILPTLLNRILRFFLKSKNLNELITSPNIQSTDTLVALIDLLKACISGVNIAYLNGACKCNRKWYAGSPYRHMACPSVENVYCSRFCNSLESPKMAASSLFPSKMWQIMKLISHFGIDGYG